MSGLKVKVIGQSSQLHAGECSFFMPVPSDNTGQMNEWYSLKA